MIKNLLKEKLKKNFYNFSIDYLEKVLFNLEEEQEFRTFNHFLEIQGIDLESYISFSPEKLIDDYLQHINIFFENAELSLISITSEKHYIYLSIFMPLYTRKVLFSLIENLKDQINIEKEFKVSLAIQTIKGVMSKMDFDFEDIH